MPPNALSDAKERLAKTERVEVISDWQRWETGEWSLRVTTRLGVASTQWMPESTAWHLVISQDGTELSVHFFPDIEAGLAYTHPHQDNNDGVVKDRPWRTGKPCLEVPVSKFSRQRWDDEPEDLVARIGWKTQRLLQWIDAAALEELLVTGDWFELPASREPRSQFPQLAFNETEAGFEAWTVSQLRWGIADLSGLTKTTTAPRVTYVKAFKGLNNEMAVVPRWGLWLSEARDTRPALWIRLDRIPILPPWQLPGTWAALNAVLLEHEIDFPRLLESFGAYLRRHHLPTSAMLLLGFPVSAKVGEPPRRLHWLAAGGLQFRSTYARRKGFRASEKDHRRCDREMAMSEKAIEWQKSVNWAPDQLRTRGDAEQALKDKRVLIIGAGSLGSAVANQLVRLGVTQLGIVDAEKLEAGNLSRHQLTLADVGFTKVGVTQAFLNRAAPDSNVAAIRDEFPGSADTRQEITGYDVILDCSASDSVLRAMGAIDWEAPKLFISLSITWKAEGLLAYTAHGSVFPAIDAMECFEMAPAPPADVDRTHHEGIGCWNPVFPAGADDVQLWAAIGVKFIRAAAQRNAREFAYFRQDFLGGVERVT